MTPIQYAKRLLGQWDLWSIEAIVREIQEEAHREQRERDRLDMLARISHSFGAIPEPRPEGDPPF